MSSGTSSRTIETAGRATGCFMGWPGLNVDITAKLMTPLQAYPWLLLTAQSAWLEACSEFATSGLAVNQQMLTVFREHWSDPQRQGGIALPTALLDTARKAVARQTEILTQFQRRLLNSCEPDAAGEGRELDRRGGAEEVRAITPASGPDPGAAPPARRDRQTVEARP